MTENVDAVHTAIYVDDVNTRRAEEIHRLGFMLGPDDNLPDRHYFRKGGDRVRTHHLSLAESGSQCYLNQTVFRDALRDNPELADRYSKLKRDLADAHRTDHLAYLNGKTDFVITILRGRGVIVADGDYPRHILGHRGQLRRSNISDDRKAYTDREFALILSKATELARSSDVAGHSSARFSLEEMKAIAVEAGMDPSLIERAARLLPRGQSESRLERLLGGPLKHRLDAHFPTKLTEHTTAHLLSAVRASVEQQGEGEANSSGMSWNSVGEGSQFLVTAHSEGEGTRVRVVVDRRGALSILATFSLLGALAMAIMLVLVFEVVELESVGLGWTLLGGAVAGTLALGRAIWASTTRGIRKKVNALMDTVTRSLADVGIASDSSEAPDRPHP